MKPMRMLVKAVTCLATLAVVMAGCGDDRLNQRTASLDENGNGLCDICENRIPPLPPELSPVKAPLDLRIEVSLAEGISPPANGRIALITYMNSADIGVHELLTEELSSSLPTVVNIRLDAFPQELIDEVVKSYVTYGDYELGIDSPTYEDIGAWVNCVLAVYDDANGNGRMDIGGVYTKHPAMDAGDEEWDRYGDETEAWEKKYGHLDFIGLSSPSDPKNEVLSLTTVSVDFLDNVPDPMTLSREKKTGYNLSREEVTCVTNRRDYEVCSCCRTESTPLDPKEIQPVTVHWELPR